MRAFPRNAVTDRKEFKTERNVKWLCSPAVKSDEHNSCPNVISLCPSLVKFAAAILM